jgi:hypothetical protein
MTAFNLAKMSRLTVGAAVGMFAVLLYFSIHISYGQNANNSSGLTRFGHIFQQLDKDTNAGNLTAKDLLLMLLMDYISDVFI